MKAVCVAVRKCFGASVVTGKPVVVNASEHMQVTCEVAVCLRLLFTERTRVATYGGATICREPSKVACVERNGAFMAFGDVFARDDALWVEYGGAHENAHQYVPATCV